MKVALTDAAVQYWSENHEQLLGISVKTTSGYSLYRPLNEALSDWERLSSSKNPADFDSIIFNTTAVHKKVQSTKIAKNNIEGHKSITTTKDKEQQAKPTKVQNSTKKVKKSFL